MSKMLNNTNKLTFIVQQYPEHTLEQVLALLEMPAIDINAAVWYAQELGWVSQVEEDRVRLLKTPESWDFGPEQAEFEDTVIYCFQQTAKNETDIEEFELSDWTAGYPRHDLLITMKRLLNDRVLAEYDVADGENTYKFYTLFENIENLWGRKRFKQEPVAGKKIEVEGEDDPGTDIEVKTNE